MRREWTSVVPGLARKPMCLKWIEQRRVTENEGREAARGRSCRALQSMVRYLDLILGVMGKHRRVLHKSKTNPCNRIPLAAVWRKDCRELK